MKKLLLVLAIGAFVACNDGGGSEETKTDTTPTVDSNTAPPPAVDTTKADTTKKPVDSPAIKK